MAGRHRHRDAAAALAAWGEGAIDAATVSSPAPPSTRSPARLLLVRDRFGVKPLYIAPDSGGLWFASEIRALLAAGVPARARPEVLVAARPRHSWVPGPPTPVEGIERLPPGSWSSVDLDDPRDHANGAGSTPPTWSTPSWAASSAAEPRQRAGDRLEAALRASVQRRLMGDVPLGDAVLGRARLEPRHRAGRRATTPWSRLQRLADRSAGPRRGCDGRERGRGAGRRAGHRRA